MMDWNTLKEAFKDCELAEEKLLVKTNLHDVIQFVKEHYPYDMLREITAIHTPEDRIELVYHLYSTIDEEDLFISVFSDGEAESIVDIFESARADENEIFDLFGVKFIGNEDLKRLYMPEDWNGHPLRKDYIQDDTRLG